jgi:hypothetical protein
MTGGRHDPSVPYTFRSEVYAAQMVRRKAELLKRWNWKGRSLRRFRSSSTQE